MLRVCVDLHGHGLCYVSVLQGMFLCRASAGIGRRRRNIEDSWQDYRRPSECSDTRCDHNLTLTLWCPLQKWRRKSQNKILTCVCVSIGSLAFSVLDGTSQIVPCYFFDLQNNYFFSCEYEERRNDSMRER